MRKKWISKECSVCTGLDVMAVMRIHLFAKKDEATCEEIWWWIEHFDDMDLACWLFLHAIHDSADILLYIFFCRIINYIVSNMFWQSHRIHGSKVHQGDCRVRRQGCVEVCFRYFGLLHGLKVVDLSPIHRYTYGSKYWFPGPYL